MEGPRTTETGHQQRAGDLAGAERFALQALAAQHSAPAWLILGEACRRAGGRLREARLAALEALQLAPLHPTARTSSIFRRTGNHFKALWRRNTAPQAGLIVIDLGSGDIVQWVKLEGPVAELYDVVVLPGVNRPKLLGFKTDEIRYTVTAERHKSVWGGGAR